MVLDINELTFQRGEDGKFIPQEVELEFLENKPKVKVIPVTRGKLQEIMTRAKSSDVKERVEADNELIRNGLVEPKISEGKLKDLKPNYMTAIIIAILSISLDKSQRDIRKETGSLIQGQEFQLKKN